MLVCSLLSTNPVMADDELPHEQSIKLSVPGAFHLFAIVYGERSRAGVDLAPREELSRAVISTADGDDIEFTWTTNAAVFLAEFERVSQTDVIVEDLRSILNDGIRLRVFERDDGQWRVEHSWMDYEGVMRMAAVTTHSREHATLLVERVALAREHGLFGSYPWVGGPLPEPPPIEQKELR